MNKTGGKLNLCYRDTLMTTERLVCTIGQKRPAEGMVKKTKNMFKDLQVQEHVDVAVIKKNQYQKLFLMFGFYQIETENRCLKRLFSRDGIILVTDLSSNIMANPEYSILLKESVSKIAKF